MELLETKGITKSYDSREIIRDISIRLTEGEIVSLLGLSGSGKTTLLNIISGLVRPDTGTVWLSGTDITGRPGFVSYMLQKDLLLEHKRVMENVMLPLVIRGMKKEEAARAALLRTYLASGGVVLLDEPFSALDMITKGQMHRWYLDVAKKIGLSTLLITHDADEAIMLSDRICLLTGTPGEIRHEIRVPAERDDRKDFDLKPAFLKCKQEIREILGA